MKLKISVLLIIVMLICFCSCGATEKAGVETETVTAAGDTTTEITTAQISETDAPATTVPATTAPEISTEENTSEKTVLEVPTYAQTGKSGYDLTENDFRELLLRANTFYVNWLYMFVDADYQDNIWDNAIYYSRDDIDRSDPHLVENARFDRVLADDYKNIEEIYATAQSIFSEEIYRNIIDYRYRMQDGKLYANMDTAGDAPPSEKFELTVESLDERDCCLSVTEWNHGFNEGESLSSHTINYKIHRDDNGNWIFTGEFDLFTTTLDENGKTVDLFDVS